MSQPYPQPYPPQGYAPQAPPQYGPPPGYAPAYPQAPQYPQGPPQPQYAPPQAPPAPGYGGAHPQGPAPSLADPDAPQSNVIRPRMLDFAREGRLVLITPLTVKREVPNRLGKPGDTQDRMTADVVILDGHPFPFGGAPEKGEPHTHTAQIPYESLSMFISSGPLISQVERHMNEPVAGRIRTKQLDNGNTAYTLDPPSESDKAQATAFLIAKAEGRIATPTPPPAAQPYGPPANQPAPQAQPQYMTQPAPLPAYAPQAPGQGQPYQQGYAPQQYPQAPPAPVNLDVAPPHIDPAWWAQQPPEVKAGYLQSPGV